MKSYAPQPCEPGIFNRSRFGDLIAEYGLSGRGCAQFVRKHPGARLARQRVLQVLGVVTATTIGLRYPRLAAAAATPFALAIGAVSIVRSGRREAAVFPVMTGILGTAFTLAFLDELVRRHNRVPATLQGVRETNVAPGRGQLTFADLAQLEQQPEIEAHAGDVEAAFVTSSH